MLLPLTGSGANLPFAAVVYGILSAITWGGGDFAGGMGAKAVGGSVPGTFRVVLAAHTFSLAAVLVLAAWRGDPIPHTAAAFHAAAFGFGAGVAAGLSLSAFYISLSAGEMGIAAAISGLLTAAIPVLVAWVTEGRPKAVQIAGFLAAAAAIYLVATSPASGKPANRRTQGLAILSGVGFGVYFVCMQRANSLGAFEPLAFARIGSLVTTALLLLLVSRGPALATKAEPKMPRAAWLAALGVAALDSAGNLFYLAATRNGRLDVAAVLASLYPVSTILLAALWLKEQPSARQWIGIGTALAGVALMAS